MSLRAPRTSLSTLALLQISSAIMWIRAIHDEGLARGSLKGRDFRCLVSGELYGLSVKVNLPGMARSDVERDLVMTTLKLVVRLDCDKVDNSIGDGDLLRSCSMTAAKEPARLPAFFMNCDCTMLLIC